MDLGVTTPIVTWEAEHSVKLDGQFLSELPQGQTTRNTGKYACLRGFVLRIYHDYGDEWYSYQISSKNNGIALTQRHPNLESIKKHFARFVLESEAIEHAFRQHFNWTPEWEMHIIGNGVTLVHTAQVRDFQAVVFFTKDKRLAYLIKKVDDVTIDPVPWFHCDSTLEVEKALFARCEETYATREVSL